MLLLSLERNPVDFAMSPYHSFVAPAILLLLAWFATAKVVS